MKKNLKAYSLLEMLVTLVVFAVLLTMMIQVLVISLDAGRRIAARSRIRGDLSTVAVMIRRDFRNASKVDESQCGTSIPTFNGKSACVFTLAGSSFAWVVGDDINNCKKGKICKLRDNGSGFELFFESSESLTFNENITKFELEVFEVNNEETQGIILATLQADPSDDISEVSTQVRQVTVFTRNF